MGFKMIKGLKLTFAVLLFALVLGAQSAGLNQAISPLEDWLERLQSTDPAIQMAAAYDLPATVPVTEETVSKLVDALQHENAFIRRYSASALGEILQAPQLTVSALMKALTDEDEQVYNHAVIALAKVGEPAVPALLEALNQDSVVVDPEKYLGRHGQTNLRLSDLAITALIEMNAPVDSTLINYFQQQEILKSSVLESERDYPQDSEEFDYSVELDSELDVLEAFALIQQPHSLVVA
jgi:HEAT repeat protein